MTLTPSILEIFYSYCFHIHLTSIQMVGTDNKNEFSGDEMIDDVGGLDLININRIDRNELETMAKPGR